MQVNGEPQKKAEEITAEVAIALTLSQLHPAAGDHQSLACGVYVIQRGLYAMIDGAMHWPRRTLCYGQRVSAVLLG